MNPESQPLVSVVVPLYNCATFLPECLESILAQTYKNWVCLIVNNCSTDGSAEIARQYCLRDQRVRLSNNAEFLKAVPNFNNALRQISDESKYCKIVFADDWIYPQCLESMVAVAEDHPTVGIVGAYGLQGRQVMWAGLPYPSSVVSGREIVRKLFLEDLYIFGTSTSLLFRSDLVRQRSPFFNESNLHADSETCLALMKVSDFGFVNQVLTYTRVRPGSLFAFTTEVNTLIAGRLHDLVTFGPDFLTPEEYRHCLSEKLREYYRFLARNIGKGRKPEFWSYHKRKLDDSGIGFSRTRLARAFIARAARLCLNPGIALEKIAGRKSAPRDPTFLEGFRES